MSPTGAIAGYVMAGGNSKRFGVDKARAEFRGQSMLARTCNLVRVATGSVSVVAAAGRYGDCGESVVQDRWPGQGPLGGIITALIASAQREGEHEWNLIVSCDMPFLTGEWLSFLVKRALASKAEVIVPRSSKGLEPLCACWRTSATSRLQTAFEEGVRKVTEAMKRLHTEVLDEADWKRFDSAERLFWNMNTIADYDEARRVLQAEGK
jgi:molybdopterin-guanine dinucleotide biosynthesis protein A